MYEYIIGKFKGILKDYIIVENSNIGYKIYTSGNTMAKMPKKDEEVKLYIKQIVREDFIGLYGFLTKDEMELFNLLLTINGVGAKASLALLSISTASNLKYSIVTGNEKTITKAQGIGKKIAQRIILELKDKIKIDDVVDAIPIVGEIEDNSSNLVEAKLALVSLGYSEKEADKALKSIDEFESIENIIKKSLKILMN